MSLICPRCGAENRDTAKFCLKCARQLVALPPATSSAGGPTKKRRSRRRSSRRSPALPVVATEASTPVWHLPLPLLGGGALLVMAVALAGAWTMLHRQAPATQTHLAQMDQQAQPLPSAQIPPAQSATAGAATPSTPTSAAAQEPDSTHPVPGTVTAVAQANIAPLAPTQPATPIPAATQAATKAAKAQQRQAERRARATMATPSPTPVVPSTAPPPPVARPVPTPTPATYAPARPTTLCADRQFISHAICLQAECDKPGMRQHPQCQRMREQQQTLRERSGDH